MNRVKSIDPRGVIVKEDHKTYELAATDAAERKCNAHISIRVFAASEEPNDFTEWRQVIRTKAGGL